MLEALVLAALEALTLDEALARARARNPAVQVAAAEVLRAEALLVQVRADALPTVVVDGNYTRLDADRETMGFRVQSADQLALRGIVTLPLVAPRRWAAWAHARDARRIAELSVADVRRQIASAVAHAYLAVIAQKRVVAANLLARDTARAHADHAQKQFEGGAAMRLDLVRATQQWRTARAQLEQAEVGLLRAREALGVLVAGDHPIDAAVEPSFALPVYDDRFAERRADLIAQRMRRTAADNQVHDSWTDWMPFVTGAFQRQLTDPPTTFNPRWGWQAQLILVFPLFEGGKSYGQLRERRALLAEAERTLEGDLRQATSEVRLGFASLARADARRVEARAAAKLAHEALDIATARYREGATTNIEVIDAERAAHDADLAAAGAEDDAQQVRLDLIVALGQELDDRGHH